MPAGEIAERIASALGLDVTARPLGEGTFVAESRAGFSAESLSRLLAALGPDTELYRDDPVSPSAVRKLSRRRVRRSADVGRERRTTRVAGPSGPCSRRIRCPVAGRRGNGS